MKSLPENEPVRISLCLNQKYRRAAAELYVEAFGQKFSVAIRDHQKQIEVIEAAVQDKYAISAFIDDQLVGIAGFQTPESSFTGGISGSSLISMLGVVRGLRAIAILSMYERHPKKGELVMDGIAVRQDHRGKGIGGKLLDALADHARNEGYKTIRLDVIDTNRDARRLYERKGFRVVREESYQWLRWLLGFGGSAVMELKLTDRDDPQSS